MVSITEFGPQQNLDGGVTIATAAPTAPADFVFPKSAELRKLEALVYRLRPRLDLRADRDFLTLNHAKEFAHSLEALSWMGRRADVDHSRSIIWWTDYARDLLREAGIEAQLPRHLFLAAMLACGDVPYSRNALGLTLAHTGAPATNAWRDVLETRAVRPASPEQAVRGGLEPGQVRVAELMHHDLPGLISTETR
ncbi:hypothetical protein [Bradyrhizobium sp. LTSP849]|uniref:hypothetical protein n=1 Tax=Bradyrhizobium sp. LTSP849 TaxID=1615890 RepID=UPI000B15CD4D|nr:hypothetical protein [Bradyrhizobium sp. LTSP849]